jgi:putative Ca2+/H+ antiporter (TMEM165/GDT1 family)
MKSLFVVFMSVFVAELGDKTQLATVLFATDPNLNRTGVFMASAVALILSSLIAVLFGAQVSRYVSPAALKSVAGAGFIVIGFWLLLSVRH